jgi:hypothetical protein
VTANSTVQTCSAAGFWEPTKTCSAGCSGNDCAADTSLYLYPTYVWRKGDLGGRSGADAICNADKSQFPTLTCTHVRAFLSVNDADEIRDMPGNYGVPTNAPVKRPDGATIDSSFAALLDGNVLVPVGPTLTNAFQIWSGSTSAGAALQTCNGWTDGLSAGGTVGDPMGTSPWLSGGGYRCDVTQPYMCLCW